MCYLHVEPSSVDFGRVREHLLLLLLRRGTSCCVCHLQHDMTMVVRVAKIIYFSFLLNFFRLPTQPPALSLSVEFSHTNALLHIFLCLVCLYFSTSLRPTLPSFLQLPRTKKKKRLPTADTQIPTQESSQSSELLLSKKNTQQIDVCWQEKEEEKKIFIFTPSFSSVQKGGTKKSPQNTLNPHFLHQNPHCTTQHSTPMHNCRHNSAVF